MSETQEKQENKDDNRSNNGQGVRLGDNMEKSTINSETDSSDSFVSSDESEDSGSELGTDEQTNINKDEIAAPRELNSETGIQNDNDSHTDSHSLKSTQSAGNSTDLKHNASLKNMTESPDPFGINQDDDTNSNRVQAQEDLDELTPSISGVGQVDSTSGNDDNDKHDIIEPVSSSSAEDNKQSMNKDDAKSIASNASSGQEEVSSELANNDSNFTTSNLIVDKNGHLEDEGNESKKEDLEYQNDKKPSRLNYEGNGSISNIGTESQIDNFDDNDSIHNTSQKEDKLQTADIPLTEEEEIEENGLEDTDAQHSKEVQIATHQLDNNEYESEDLNDQSHRTKGNNLDPELQRDNTSHNYNQEDANRDHYVEKGDTLENLSMNKEDTPSIIREDGNTDIVENSFNDTKPDQSHQIDKNSDDGNIALGTEQQKDSNSYNSFNEDGGNKTDNLERPSTSDTTSRKSDKDDNTSYTSKSVTELVTEKQNDNASCISSKEDVLNKAGDFVETPPISDNVLQENNYKMIDAASDVEDNDIKSVLNLSPGEDKNSDVEVTSPEETGKNDNGSIFSNSETDLSTNQQNESTTVNYADGIVERPNTSDNVNKREDQLDAKEPQSMISSPDLNIEQQSDNNDRDKESIGKDESNGQIPTTTSDNNFIIDEKGVLSKNEDKKANASSDLDSHSIKAGSDQEAIQANDNTSLRQDGVNKEDVIAKSSDTTENILNEIDNKLIDAPSHLDSHSIKSGSDQETIPENDNTSLRQDGVNKEDDIAKSSDTAENILNENDNKLIDAPSHLDSHSIKSGSDQETIQANDNTSLRQDGVNKEDVIAISSDTTENILKQNGNKMINAPSHLDSHTSGSDQDTILETDDNNSLRQDGMNNEEATDKIQDTVDNSLNENENKMANSPSKVDSPSIKSGSDKGTIQEKDNASFRQDGVNEEAIAKSTGNILNGNENKIAQPSADLASHSIKSGTIQENNGDRSSIVRDVSDKGSYYSKSGSELANEQNNDNVSYSSSIQEINKYHQSVNDSVKDDSSDVNERPSSSTSANNVGNKSKTNSEECLAETNTIQEEIDIHVDNNNSFKIDNTSHILGEHSLKSESENTATSSTPDPHQSTPTTQDKNVDHQKKMNDTKQARQITKSNRSKPDDGNPKVQNNQNIEKNVTKNSKSSVKLVCKESSEETKNDNKIKLSSGKNKTEKVVHPTHRTQKSSSGSAVTLTTSSTAQKSNKSKQSTKRNTTDHKVNDTRLTTKQTMNTSKIENKNPQIKVTESKSQDRSNKSTVKPKPATSCKERSKVSNAGKKSMENDKHINKTRNKSAPETRQTKLKLRSKSSPRIGGSTTSQRNDKDSPIKSAPPTRRSKMVPGKDKKSGSQTDRTDYGKKKGGGTPRDGRRTQKEYFKEELKRLRDSLQKESDKIKEPEKKEYSPYTFNSLKPYYSTNSAQYIIDMPDEVRHGYVSRSTAVGLCDPWVDHHMDLHLLPKIQSKAVKNDKGKAKRKSGERPAKEGSTRLPKFPAVKVPAGDLATKKLYYSDVKMLREELRKKYSSNADGKIDEEYQRTKKDFYRMELDRMDEYHPVSRPNMRKAYFAYLQNNPGSKKAVYECVKTAEKEEEEDDKEEPRSARDNASAKSTPRQTEKSEPIAA